MQDIVGYLLIINNTTEEFKMYANKSYNQFKNFSATASPIYLLRSLK